MRDDRNQVITSDDEVENEGSPVLEIANSLGVRDFNALKQEVATFLSSDDRLSAGYRLKALVLLGQCDPNDPRGWGQVSIACLIADLLNKPTHSMLVRAIVLKHYVSDLEGRAEPEFRVVQRFLGLKDAAPSFYGSVQNELYYAQNQQVATNSNNIASYLASFISDKASYLGGKALQLKVALMAWLAGLLPQQPGASSSTANGNAPSPQFFVTSQAARKDEAPTQSKQSLQDGLVLASDSDDGFVAPNNSQASLANGGL